MAKDAPVLRQTVKWGEEYVSRALNLKVAGIVQPGVYHGYRLRPGGLMAVLVEHDDDYPRSVAVVERDGYSLTVIMDDPGFVSVPAKGTWYICIEAFYSPTQQGYQRIVCRDVLEPHHVVLGKVYAGTLIDPNTGHVPPDDGNPTITITEEMLSEQDRSDADIASSGVMNSILGVQADIITRLVRVSADVTSLNMAHAGTKKAGF